ncbi:MAG: flippase [Bacteroidetes bacterium]|nr:flippase [Bacteroidota bacterium]
MFEKINLLVPFGNFIRNKSLQNFLFLALIQSSTVLISIISMPLLIQSIGAEQFGWVNLSLSVIIVFNILVGFGFNLSAPREVALNQSNKAELSQLVSNIFSAKLLLAAFSTGLILLGAYGFNLFEGYRHILVLSVFLLFSEASFPLWFFQGMEKMKLVSVATIFSKLLFLMGLVLVIHKPEQSHWVNFLLGISGLGVNLCLLLYIHVILDIRFFSPQFSSIWKNLKDNVLLFFSNLASHISINGGLIILSFFASAATLGMYSLAERVVMILRLFPALIIQAIFPNSSKLYQADQTSFFYFLKKVYFGTLGIAALISVATYLAAPWIIQVLSRGQLGDAVGYLRLLAFIPFLASLNVGNVTILLVTNLRDLLFRTSWMFCAYMICASTVLTHFYGAVGLCYGILSTELMVFFISLFLLYRHKKDLLYGFYS